MFGDTVIVSSRYSGFITWLSSVDLAGLVGNYYFKVEFLYLEFYCEGG